LGFEAARALLEHGLSGLMIFDVNPAEAQAKIAGLAAEFPAAKIKSKKVDITDDVAIGEAIAQTAEVLGSVDILLCFAGVVGCTHAIDMTAAEWRRTLDINTTGSFLCAQAAAKQMIAQQTGGSILFTASISGHRVNFPQPQVAYNVSKAALITLKNSLAAEWARYGIRVNSISPGYMDTILNEGQGIAEARAVWAERNPMGRMGNPSELTGAVVLLSSSAGTYMNGKIAFQRFISPLT
jgi:sorbose reductase